MNVKKFGMCISDYTLKLKELIDQLEYDDYAITEEDTIMYLIDGLDRKYESVVLTLLACMQNELISLYDGFSLLLSYEAGLRPKMRLI